MPMRLDEGWNQIQFNLSDFTRRAYGTNYVETLRVQIHANCRIRRIYFSDRLYSEEELPPEFKLFIPTAPTTRGESTVSAGENTQPLGENVEVLESIETNNPDTPSTRNEIDDMNGMNENEAIESPSTDSPQRAVAVPS